MHNRTSYTSISPHPKNTPARCPQTPHLTLKGIKMGSTKSPYGMGSISRKKKMHLDYQPKRHFEEEDLNVNQTDAPYNQTIAKNKAKNKSQIKQDKMKPFSKTFLTKTGTHLSNTKLNTNTHTTSKNQEQTKSLDKLKKLNTQVTEVTPSIAINTNLGNRHITAKYITQSSSTMRPHKAKKHTPTSAKENAISKNR